MVRNFGNLYKVLSSNFIVVNVPKKCIITLLKVLDYYNTYLKSHMHDDMLLVNSVKY